MKYPHRPEEGVRSLRAGITGSCDPSGEVLGTEPRSSLSTVHVLNH